MIPTQTLRTSCQRGRCPRNGLVGLAVVVLGSLVGVCLSAGQRPSCGVYSLFDFCMLAGRELSQEERDRLGAAYPSKEAQMLDIQRAAKSLGLTLAGFKASLDELEHIPGPKIVHLKEPADFVVVARCSPAWVQLQDRGFIIVAPREQFENRYTGSVLVLETGEEKRNGPALSLEEFHYSFGIAGVGQEIEHAFKVSNAGDGDLTIGLQAKGCGAPDASIGKETLAPGESTDLTVKFTVTYSGNVTCPPETGPGVMLVCRALGRIRKGHLDG